jgi:hypothetical protein
MSVGSSLAELEPLRARGHTGEELQQAQRQVLQQAGAQPALGQALMRSQSDMPAAAVPVYQYNSMRLPSLSSPGAQQQHKAPSSQGAAMQSMSGDKLDAILRSLQGNRAAPEATTAPGFLAPAATLQQDAYQQAVPGQAGHIQQQVSFSQVPHYQQAHEPQLLQQYQRQAGPAPHAHQDAVVAGLRRDLAAERQLVSDLHGQVQELHAVLQQERVQTLAVMDEQHAAAATKTQQLQREAQVGVHRHPMHGKHCVLSSILAWHQCMLQENIKAKLWGSKRRCLPKQGPDESSTHPS